MVVSLAYARTKLMVRMKKAVAILLVRDDARSTGARIADFAALARAMRSGIGLPLGLMR